MQSASPGASAAAQKLRKQRRKVLTAAAQLLSALACVAVASYLVAARVLLPPVLDVPFALYTAAFVLALLSGDALLGAWRRRRGAPTPATSPAAQRSWHDAPLADVLAALRCSGAGLAAADAAARLAAHGRNERAPPPRATSLFVKLLDECHEPQQQLLLVVAVLFALVGEAEEAALALAVIFFMMLAETWTEMRAKAAMRSLGSSAPALTAVLRDGEPVLLERSLLVPGDVILLRAGHKVPADARLLDSRGLACDEARLSGESVPAAKHAAAGAPLPAHAPLAERSNMVHGGTLVTRGAGRAVVCATGAASELGRVLHAARAAAGAQQPPTPVQRQLRSLAGTLSIAALLASLAGGLVGLGRRMTWQDVILCALSLAFATIPEELPILTAAVLALGARALSVRGIFVKRMRALESLACVDTVLIDKTGTVTHGRLRLARVVLPDGASLDVPAAQAPPEARLAALLDAWRRTADDGGFDPFDAAVGGAFSEELSSADSALSNAPPASRATFTDAELALCGDAPFDVAIRAAARAYAHPALGARVVYLKGAPDALLPRCVQAAQCSGGGAALALRPLPREAADALAAQVAAAAEQGLRTLAFARAVTQDGRNNATSAAVEELDLAECCAMPLVLLGVLCFDDPPREEAAAAVAACHAAGIRVTLVSGDHVATVEAIARRVGILPAQGGMSAVHCGEAEAAALGTERASAEAPASASASADDEPPAAPAWAAAAAEKGECALARAAPAHKLALVRAHAAAGRTVLVTGDGANDAPALAAAAVGMAAAAATDMAREAAAVVVLNGDLSSIAVAVAEGRRLHDNLTSALAFYLGAKAGLVLLFIVGTIWRGFPLAAVQIIVLELYMDLGASLSFCSEAAEPGIMRRPPLRSDAPLFDAQMLFRIAAGCVSMSACVLSGYAWGLYSARLPDGATQLQHANSMAFVCWLMGHILLAFNQRTAVAPTLSKGAASNRIFVAWALATAALCVLVGTTRLDVALSLRHLAARDWGVAVACCVGGTCWVEALKWGLLLRRRARADAAGSIV